MYTGCNSTIQLRRRHYCLEPCQTHLSHFVVPAAAVVVAVYERNLTKMVCFCYCLMGSRRFCGYL